MAVEYIKRTIMLVFGLFLFACGSFLSIHANIGLAPWEAFSMGIFQLTGISYGNVLVLTGVLILFIDYILKEKLGFGTLLNTVLVGKFADFILSFEIMPMMTNFWVGLVMLLLSQVIVCLGSYLYIGAAMGCGPRDALMVALGKRFANVPIGAIRALIEGTALLVGWLLGAKVGVGTVISVFGIGFILQYTFRILKFDVKAVVHESVVDTVKRFALRKRNPPLKRGDGGDAL